MSEARTKNACGIIRANQTYVVPGDADPQRMIEDVGCWLDSACGILGSTADYLSSPERTNAEKLAAKEVFAALHLIRIAHDVAGAIESRLLQLR